MICFPVHVIILCGSMHWFDDMPYGFFKSNGVIVMRLLWCQWHVLEVHGQIPLVQCHNKTHIHYNDVIVTMMATQIISLTIVNSTVYSGADQRNQQSFASLAFVLGIHRWPVNSPHKGPGTRKMFPFYDVIMLSTNRMHIVCDAINIVTWSSLIIVLLLGESRS